MRAKSSRRGELRLGDHRPQGPPVFATVVSVFAALAEFIRLAAERPRSPRTSGWISSAGSCSSQEGDDGVYGGAGNDEVRQD
jgi:hypothetical protein